MRLPVLFLVFSALALAGCSGSGGSSADVTLRCASREAFCLISCNLGCSQLGRCSITEIAENQPIRLTFSQSVNPATVNSSSISIKTAAGRAPDGEYVVNGNEVVFQPRIRVQGGVTTFGFTRNETYILTLAGGAAGQQSIRSVSGDILSSEFSCSLTVTRGIIDLDQAPPRAEVVSPDPNTTGGIPLDSTFVLRFSELLDTTAFTGATAQTSPINYHLRRVDQGLCVESGPPISIEGVPRLSTEVVGGIQRTVVSLTPSIILPGGACVQVIVTDRVRDLAGTPAQRQVFTFFTVASNLSTVEIRNTFEDAQKQDPLISSGIWQNGARPGRVGSDGRHGSFDVSLGNPVGSSTFEWDTDNFTIPGTNTLNGLEAVVTDGKFFFTDFVLEETQTVRFVGSNPAQVFVRGRVDIAGKVESNGAAMTVFQARDRFSTALLPGQPGGEPGAGGGRGGDGADRCGGNGPRIVSGVNTNDGQPGEDVQLLAGHAYASRAMGTGGLGSGLFPADGLNNSIVYRVSFGAFSGMMAAGGGGGGLWQAGDPGTVVSSPSPPPNASEMGPDSVPGMAFDPFPVPPSVSSLNHFLIGGSGGGGGGSHPFLAVILAFPDTWKAGAGGSGGGGAIAFRAGNELRLQSTGRLEAKGGEGFMFTDQNMGIPAPGGGGSGGSFLLQSGNNVVIAGIIDTSGGNGSSTGNITPANLNGVTRGGAGSPGIYRIETPSGNATITNTSLVPMLDPARNLGTLQDRDDLVGAASIWEATRLVFPPDWLRYELEVEVNGMTTIFSDDPAIGMPANDPTGPVRVQFQGAQVSPTTGQPDPSTIQPWRDFVGNGQPNLNMDSATGLRYMLIFNIRDFPNTVVRRLSIFYRA